MSIEDLMVELLKYVNRKAVVFIVYFVQREITRKLTFPKQPTNPFLEMVKFLLERIAPVHIDSEAIRSEKNTDIV